MGGGVNVMVAKLCDSCKSASATVFCRPDSAYLCIECDAKVHAANKLASRHPRVWVCEVCEQAPASVTCKADAAHLCSACDRDIHSANPLARRHQRLPLSPFFCASVDHGAAPNNSSAAARCAAINKLFGEEYYSDAEEAEAASWLLPNPNPNTNNNNTNNNNKGGGSDEKSMDFLFSGTDGDDMDPYLDLDFGGDPKPDPSVDGVVPDPDHTQHQHQHQHQQPGFYSVAPSYHHHLTQLDHHSTASKPYSFSSYNAAPQPCLSHSVSSSSLDFGVVPDGSGTGEAASTGGGEKQQMKMVGMDREARVLRYREKRKNRKFQKTIRYASRKAYAETRPRIKGRFAKRSDVEAASVDDLFASDPPYALVPSF